MEKNQEIKMGKGNESGVDWQRQFRTFYDDASLNNFLKAQRDKPFRILKGPTPTVVGDKIAWTLECVCGENQD